ncbi:MAG: polyphenol oxidase family protein [Gemmatimonadales bacterium]
MPEPHTPLARFTEQVVPDSTPPRFELTPWRDRFGVVAGITGAGPGADMGIGGETARDEVESRWRRLMRGVGASAVVVSRQVHGTAIAKWKHSDGINIVAGYDGHVTSVPGLLLAVTLADCVPVYLTAAEGGVVALVHAGWRGIAAGILERALDELAADGWAARDLVMHCGVSICGGCYEVGSEVHRAVTGCEVAAPAGLDLREELVARAQLLEIKEVTISTYCTIHTAGRFFSHRGSGGANSRMVAYLGRFSA